MKTLWILIACAVTAHAEGAGSIPAVEYSWTDETIADGLERIPPSGEETEAWIRVTGTPGSQTTTQLLLIEGPAVTSVLYAIEGVLRARDVEGAGYLEMWNVFSDGTRYFSRTQADNGPMAWITGTDSDRSFQVPFNREGSDNPPIRLEINLVLPGGGSVDVGPIRLVELRSGPTPGKQQHVPFVALLAIAGVLLLMVLVISTTVRRSIAARSESVEERKMKSFDA